MTGTVGLSNEATDIVTISGSATDAIAIVGCHDLHLWRGHLGYETTDTVAISGTTTLTESSHLVQCGVSLYAVMVSFHHYHFGHQQEEGRLHFVAKVWSLVKVAELVAGASRPFEPTMAAFG